MRKASVFIIFILFLYIIYIFLKGKTSEHIIYNDIVQEIVTSENEISEIEAAVDNEVHEVATVDEPINTPNNIIVTSISHSIVLYRRAFGEYPKIRGNNLVSVIGDNSLRIRLYYGEHIHDDGSAVDFWGSPLGISINGDAITVRSAGRNKQMGDDDDFAYTTTYHESELSWYMWEQSIKGTPYEEAWNKAIKASPSVKSKYIPFSDPEG